MSELDIINYKYQCIPHCSPLCNPSYNKDYQEYKDIHKKIQEYLFSHDPIFKKKLNYENPSESKENTYLINKISANSIEKIIKFLKFSKYKEIYLSLIDTQICALTYKSYAFYKSIIDEFGKTIYVFCFQNDINCKGLLLSPVV